MDNVTYAECKKCHKVVSTEAFNPTSDPISKRGTWLNKLDYDKGATCPKTKDANHDFHAIRELI